MPAEEGRMSRWFAVVAAWSLASGCVGKKKYDALQAELIGNDNARIIDANNTGWIANGRRHRKLHKIRTGLICNATINNKHRCIII